MRKGLLWTLAALAALAPRAGADSLWKSSDTGFFADHRAHEAGELLTVLIVESTTGAHQASSQTSKENKFSSSGGPGTGGLFKWLGAFSADGKSKNEFNGSGQADVSNKLNARMTVRVTRVEPNGNLAIEGSRTVQINHEQEDLKLTAVVRPEDIHADNTVLSTYLADANISYKGRGQNSASSRQGLISRFLNWVF